MKTWIISAVCIIVGGILGASGTYLLLTRHYSQFLESRHAIMALDQMNVLSHLKSGKGEELLRTLEEHLPQWAAVIPSVIQNPQRANEVLWEVQRYYEEYEVAVPATLQPLLDVLPPRPPTSCEINRPE